MNETTQYLIDWIEENQSDFTKISDIIWETPELAFQEFKASRTQADYLEKAGFKITWDLGGLNTAFMAEWGQGAPVLGFIGEYDALPGLSQKIQPTKEPVQEGAPGQGCGHNLLGTAAMASVAALKEWLQSTGKPATIRYYGCPAEEKGSGKVYMARDGVFDDLDAAFNFHPASLNLATKGSCVGVNSVYYRFFGRTAHAGGSPHEGRSALDAVELMNVGVNYLREHVKDDVRIHYIITDGGKAPNIVPEEAEVYYFIRAAKPDYLAEVTERVLKVAEGAAMMTETRVEVHFEDGCSPLLSNHYLADLQHTAMGRIGPIEFTPEEIAFAQTINDAFPGTNADYVDQAIEHYRLKPALAASLDEFRDQPLVGKNFSSFDEDNIGTGSTDVGDVSQIVPLSMLVTACFPTGVPGHSWGEVATSGMSIGHKGMLHAAKVMAVAASDLIMVPGHLVEVRQEFEAQTKGKTYKSPIPADRKPPHFEPGS